MLKWKRSTQNGLKIRFFRIYGLLKVFRVLFTESNVKWKILWFYVWPDLPCVFFGWFGGYGLIKNHSEWTILNEAKELFAQVNRCNFKL